MNAILRKLLGVAALAAALSPRLIFGQPLPAPTVPGRVLVFDHGGVIEGAVERIGDRYRIRSGAGETWVPTTGVLGVAADKESAYQLFKLRAKPKDAKEHVRLARWCQSQGLKARAVAEAEAALALKPGDRSLQYFRDQMKTFAAEAPVAVAAPQPPAAPRPVPDAPPIDVNPESLGLFVTKVQPILMNACAKCHAAEYGGKFKLAHAPGNPKAINVNLAAVSASIDRQQPSASPLLVKAVAVHGDAGGPPLKDRQAAAYKYLEEWVRQATGNSFAPVAPPAALAPAVIADSQPLAPTRGIDFAVDADPKPAAAPAKPNDSPKLPADAPKDPIKPTPGDPFDPAVFNQQNPPKKP